MIAECGSAEPYSAPHDGSGPIYACFHLWPVWLSLGSPRAAHRSAGDPRRGFIMRIRVGCELSFEFPQITPMIAMLNVHFSRFSDLERPDHLMTNPSFPVEGYREGFG